MRENTFVLLYISRDYQMLYGNSEDYMTFELFALTEKR